MTSFPLALCESVIEIARRLHSRNCLAAADGNISVRVSDQEIWMTPSGVAKAFIKPEQMACLDLDGTIQTGTPSGERLMHLEIYRKCPEAKAIVHAHPPSAIAWMLARPQDREFPVDLLPEILLACGEVPIVPYARPGTEQMGTALHPYLPHRKALLLSRHGAVCWGESLEEAWRGLERIEHAAQILILAQQLGGAQPIPPEELAALRELRKQIGNRLL